MSSATLLAAKDGAGSFDDAGPDAASFGIHAVVLYYRNWPGILTTVQAVMLQLGAGRILVVDNASGDGRADEIAERCPGVEVVRAPSNRGYAAGMNCGLAAWRARHNGVLPAKLLLLTHECVLRPGALAAMGRTLDTDPGAGLAGPVLLRPARDDALWSRGGGFSRWGRPDHPGQNGPAIAGGPPQRVSWIDGAAVVIRREALEAIGGLDEDYFLYMEDVDLGLRCERAGFHAMIVPEAVAEQEPGGIMPPYLDVRNRILLWRKHRRWDRLASSLVAVGIKTILDLPRHPAPPSWRRRARLLGAWHGLTGDLDRQRATMRTREAGA